MQKAKQKKKKLKKPKEVKTGVYLDNVSSDFLAGFSFIYLRIPHSFRLYLQADLAPLVP